MGRSALLADSQGNLRADRGSYLMFTCLPCRKQSDQVARPQEPRRAGRAGRLRAVVRGTRTPAVPGTSRLSVLLVAARRWVLAGNTTSTCSALRARASRAVSSSVCTWSGSPFLVTGVYNTSRNALVPTLSAASAASLAFLATLAGPRLLDEDAPAIMTAACTWPSSPPGATMQPLVENGSVMHDMM